MLTYHTGFLDRFDWFLYVALHFGKYWDGIISTKFPSNYQRLDRYTNVIMNMFAYLNIFDGHISF